jgi:hypothetical protein
LKNIIWSSFCQIFTVKRLFYTALKITAAVVSFKLSKLNLLN